METILEAALVLLIIGIPFARLYRRAGLNRLWLVLLVVPIVGIFGVWLVLAVSDWPAQAAAGR
jgi:hypothetical protein